jgi:uncharacterized protein (DUF362 family)
VARVAIICPDLLFGSRVESGVVGAGHEIVAVDDSPDLVIADIEAVDPNTVEGVKRLGFYPHIQGDLKKNAFEAGFDIVVPRSKMNRELRELLERLLPA